MSAIVPFLVVGGGLIAFVAIASNPSKNKAPAAPVGGAPSIAEAKAAEDKLWKAGKDLISSVPTADAAPSKWVQIENSVWNKEDPVGIGGVMQEMVGTALSNKIDNQALVDGATLIAAATRARLGRLANTTSFTQSQAAMIESILKNYDNVFFSAEAKKENAEWAPLARSFVSSLMATALKVEAAKPEAEAHPVATADEAYSEARDAWLSGNVTKTLEGGAGVKSGAAIPGVKDAEALAATYRARAARLGATPAALKQFDDVKPLVSM